MLLDQIHQDSIFFQLGRLKILHNKIDGDGYEVLSVCEEITRLRFDQKEYTFPTERLKSLLYEIATPPDRIQAMSSIPAQINPTCTYIHASK